jgi:hypothetical protein
MARMDWFCEHVLTGNMEIKKIWEDDLVTPPQMGRYLASAIPNCQARFIAREGHFSLLPKHVEEILNTLVYGKTDSS